MRALVVGAGAYGLACAERMAREGAEVTVLEERRAGHPHAASGGETRVLRFEYGAAARYTELTRRAVPVWRRLGERAGEELFVPRGVVHLAQGEGAFERRSAEVVAAAGLPVQLLEPDEIASRWPAFALDDVSFGLWSPEGGFVRARRATEVLADAARAAGVQVREGVRVADVEDGTVRLADGERLTADVVVLCTGSWSGLVEPRLAGVVPTRQITAIFEGDVGRIPVFGDGGLNFYSIPEERGTKVGWHRTEHRDAGDPGDVAERRVSDEDVAPLREYVGRRLPALAGARVLAADVCFYAMTPDEDPVVDRLDERTVACCGLSGHGFKFSPVLGAAAGELALGLEPTVDLRGFEVSRLTAAR